MKAIILAGGTGSRLAPLTDVVSKQLLPVYDKPLIYYPLSTAMLAGARDILIITNPENLSSFQKLFASSMQLGLNIQYAVQNRPEGIAQAISIAENFIGTSNTLLILGDNIFYGSNLGRNLEKISSDDGCVIFGYRVNDPENYGVVEFDKLTKQVKKIVEKPKSYISNIAVTGMYLFDNTVFKKFNTISKSPRGEYEISSLLNLYITDGTLKMQMLERGTAWLDCGTADNLISAGNFVKLIEDRQTQKIACIEEISFVKGWINREQLLAIATNHPNQIFGKYLKEIAIGKE
jgi:glucose-1-phosphate thymidylyltransferase